MNQPKYLETLYPSWGQQFVMNEVLFEYQTEHQHLVIFKNQQWGTVMALDGVIQTTEKDEFIYHETMTHVPMLSHPNPQKVLIIGGGDGGILREVLKHNSVERVVQVEIDSAVIDMCKKYFPNHSQGAYDNPKVEIIIDDGLNFVANCSEKFDVIISDSTDPIGPGESLFTSDFYDGVRNCLNHEGVFVAQNGVSFMQLDEVKTTKKRLGSYFDEVTFYSASIPTYVGGIMTFAWPTNNSDLRKITLQEIESRFERSELNCKYYNPSIHFGSFALPQYIHRALEVKS